MNHSAYRHVPRFFQWVLIAVVASALFSTARADDAVTETPESLPAPDPQVSDNSRPGPVGLNITGASAGITTDYFEQAVTDALAASGIFSGIDNSKTAETIMPMIRAKGVFPGTPEIGNTPYFLDVRIVKLDTPTFSVYMTVGMHVVWTLYRTAEKTELLHEKIYSTYTGGMFEGGIHGANRVRVATEGATRENIRIGVEMLEALDIEQKIELAESGQE
jgi:hypothetical protein